MLPDVSNFYDADALLQKCSKTYKELASQVIKEGGYKIIYEQQEWLGCWYPDRRIVAIRPDVKGPLMVSVIAYEIANASKNGEKINTDVDARFGVISQEQFVERHETIEWQALYLHYKILKEIDTMFGDIPEEMFCFSVTTLKKTIQSCAPPDKKAYLITQNESGHSEHYRKWYLRQRGLI